MRRCSLLFVLVCLWLFVVVLFVMCFLSFVVRRACFVHSEYCRLLIVDDCLLCFVGLLNGDRWLLVVVRWLLRFFLKKKMLFPFLFVCVPLLLLVVYCLAFVVCCVGFVVFLCVVCCLLFAMRCVLFVVYRFGCSPLFATFVVYCL